jgi:hypothetical protein
MNSRLESASFNSFKGNSSVMSTCGKLKQLLLVGEANGGGYGFFRFNIRIDNLK